MIGDTLSVTLDGVAYTLPKINQDNFTSRYYFRDSTRELTYNVRSAMESQKVNGNRAFERHQCELIHTVFGTEASEDKTFTASTVVRLQKGNDPVIARKVALALTATLTASLVDKVINWES